MRVDTPCSLFQIAGLALLAACGPGPGSERAVPVADRSAAGLAAGPVAGAGAAPAAKKDEAVAQLREDVPLPLTKLLAHSQAEVEAQLGALTGKGMDRGSCVRFVPKRVFFTCQYVLRPYTDKTGTFEEVIVSYEDGLATELTFDGLKAGSGAFAPEALLRAIGLTMAVPGKLSNPSPKVRLWSWFNSLARLRIADKEYRVEVSVVGDDWSLGRVSVIQNDHLTSEQQARVVAPREPKAPLISEPPSP